MVVTPHVFAWRGDNVMSLNHEAQRGIWIPLAYLGNPAHRSTLQIRTPLGRMTFPCCRYQGYCIWGLSYSMLQEFLRKRGEG